MGFVSKYSGEEIEVSLDLVSIIFNRIYPIGSIYISAEPVNPGTQFGGTWEQIKGKFLIGADNVYGAGTTGGSISHIHATSNHILTTSEIPAHTHTRGTMNITGEWSLNSDANNAGLDAPNSGSGAIIAKNGTGSGSNVAGTSWGVTSGFKFDASKAWTGATSSVGEGVGHNHGDTTSSNNLPPYLAVYIWKRIS